MSRSSKGKSENLRKLPSVEVLASGVGGVPHHLAVVAAREELARVRAAVLAGGALPRAEDLAVAVARGAAALTTPALRPAINATGVVLHTNLGRAPLAPAAVEHLTAIAAGYCNLEYDLERGVRGSRASLGVRGSRASLLEPLLVELSGAEAALAVNNNAAAVMLALAALASGGEVLVSRGELVEIGGSFRVPDILAQSGATLVEVGTTNRTRLADYEAALGSRTTAILRVHQSNFKIVGFTEAPPDQELARLAHGRRLPLVHDLGSGALEEVHGEPTVRAAVAAGVDVVCCSGDKLLGGPQAGIIFGRREAIERCRRHPLARALRLDKLQIAALEATLRAHRDGGRAAIPALAMIDAGDEQLAARAEAMARAIGDAAEVGWDGGTAGGGSLADLRLDGPVCTVDTGRLGADELLARLREAQPPVVARIVHDRVVLDPRTMVDSEAAAAGAAVRAALGS